MKTTSVYNPTKNEFVLRFRGKTFILPPHKTMEFPENIGNHIYKHLKLSMDYNDMKKTYEDSDFILMSKEIGLY